MRAVRFTAFGEPQDVLRVEDIPLPKPGPGEVRVCLTHRAVNPSDLETVRGNYGRLPDLPATPGMEGVGVVDAVGDSESRIQPGQRVIPLSVGGSWKEYAVAPEQALLLVPDEVDDHTAAQFVVNPVTAWVMLKEELQLSAGDWLLQTAAGSTLGRLVLQLAGLEGIRTINFVRRREQVDELRALGADVVICTQDDDVVQQVRAATGNGATGGIDAVGGETGALALRSLRPGGALLAYGMLGREPTPVSNGEMLFRGTSIRGFWLVQWFRRTPPERTAATLGRLMDLMKRGMLTPPVEAEYDLADVVAAVIHAERPGRQGKVLLTG